MSFSEDNGVPAPIFNLRPSKSLKELDLLWEEVSDSDISDKEDREEENDGAYDNDNIKLPPVVEAANDDEQQHGASSVVEKKQQKSPPMAGKNHKKSKRLSFRQPDPPCRDVPKEGEKWPERSSLSFTRSLMFYGHGTVTEEHITACNYIQECQSLRKKYNGGDGTNVDSLLLSSSSDISCRFGPDGVMELYNSFKKKNLCSIPSIDEFIHDYEQLVAHASDGAMRSFCFQRLQLLSSAFKMHVVTNGPTENEAQSNLLGTDFYRTMKVDNHIHLAAAASARQFVHFVKRKLEKEGDFVVLEDGQTLREVFRNNNLNEDHLTIDAFNVLADYSVYQRFDNFNSKYSPFRMAQMRKIFLKTDNHINGRYFAELTKYIFSRFEESKGHNSLAEMRLSIYGMEPHEWHNLAKWVLNDWTGDYPGPVLSSHNRWMVQVPRLWRIFSKKGGAATRNFQEMLTNLFQPIFDATLKPEEHPEVAELLKHIVGFDSVDDEGSPEEPCCCTRPDKWTTNKNPAYAWQLYFLWANIEVLNKLRASKGLNTFAFRPHAGETGDTMHLAATYLLCHSINHGINLDRQVSLQYLYYLDQIGLSISPLSNNFLFRKMNQNPFPKFFKRGLNVTLSTDDPLLFHLSDDALLEEYSVARASYDLSMTDISEIARNSILQSGFEDELKSEWLGPNYKRGMTHCDELKTHVPLIRAKFREEHLALEKMLVRLMAAGKGVDMLKEMMVQFSLARDGHRNIMKKNAMEVPHML